jgi:hypothetical protein
MDTNFPPRSGDETPTLCLDVCPFTLYSLRIVPLWDGEAEYIELGGNLQAIVDTIVREKSLGSLPGNDIRPMRFCQIEQEEALFLPGSHKTFYARERSPVWKVMVPASGIYSRDTIMSCIGRSAGRNVEKYESVLCHHPQAVAFYTYSSNEIRPVDESVFIIEQQAR